MSLDTRAVENIATAPASTAERIVAGWAAAAFLVFCAITVPFGGIPLPQNTAFLPAIEGIAIAALALTAVLFYVQYRIARSTQAALMALGYAANAVLTMFVVFTFPSRVEPGANSQSAVWIGVASQVMFGGFLIAFGTAGRYGWRLSRVQVRWLAVVTALLVAACVLVAMEFDLPPLVAGREVLPLWNVAIAPLVSVEMIVALVYLVSGGLTTVSQVWLSLVTLMYLGQAAILNTTGGGGRFTLGWYAGRGERLVASALLLSVFLVKFNEVLLRLASRNRALAQQTEVAELELTLGELRYRSLANIVPQLIWTASADGDIDYVNDRWVDYTGLDLEETRQRGWRAAIDPAQPTSLQDAWHMSLRNGQPLRGEYRLRQGSSGRIRWFLVNAIPTRDGAGALERWIATCTDIDQSKRIEEREAFLARAGDRLSASLDVSATLATIAALAVERMAAWTRVDLLDEDGHFATVEAASARREEDRALRALVGRPVDARVEGVFSNAVGRRELVVEPDARALAPGVAVRPGNAVIVPLTSGDTQLGVLTLVRPESNYPDSDDIAVARDFGRRAAQALDHARLYERERTTADALQRAMLPQVLPQLSNVDFSASYSAASETQRVGGDFYDAFTLPDGRVALTIGDVTGHGLDAAVTMGEIRQALRASSFELADPMTILDRASRLLIASGRSLFVTAVFAVLDTQSGLFRYATAGHPTPLVFDGRRLIRLPGSGLPIGLRDDEGANFALTLPVPCTIVLYTDGLLEFARDIDEGERRIEAAVRGLGESEVGQYAASIMKCVLGSDQPTDDIAILTASVHAVAAGPRHERYEWRFRSSDGRTAVTIRRQIGALIGEWTARPAAHDGEVAFGELYSNVVRHAPGPIEVVASQTEGGAELAVTDRGPGFAAEWRPAVDLAESGRGLALVRALADDLRVSTNPEGGSTVRVSFHRVHPVVAEVPA